MKRMILVDGNSLMYRAFYGMNVNNLVPNKNGLYTNAIYNFARMINHLIKSDYDNILVAFDAGKQTVRHELMQDYKAGRSPMPDEFRMQIAYIKEFLNIMHIAQYEQPLYEADDIIGTMSLKAEKEGYHCDIYSSDKDLLQLISNNTTVHLTKKGMTELEDYTPELFKERYEISYNQFIDLKALMGDKSDNLPGVSGIGEKKAVKYLLQYNDLDNLINHADEIKGKDGENIRNDKDKAKLCQKMATIIRDFDINLTLDDTKRRDLDKEKLIEFYKNLEFNSLLKDIEVDKPKVLDVNYKILTNEDDIDSLLVDNSALIFETFDYNYHQSPLLAVGVTNSKGAFILTPELICNNTKVKEFMSKNNHKIIFDYKRAFVVSKRFGFELSKVDFDLLLATYVINSNVAKEEFKSIAEFYNYSNVYYDEEVYGKGVKRAIPEKNLLYTHIIRKSNALYSLKDEALNRLNEKDQLKLMTDIEIPLSRVLGKMEFEGMMIDKEELQRQERDLNVSISELEEKIYELAGMEFNISSPKQLGEVLFEKMGLPYPKKTSKSYSTDIDTLNKIRTSSPIVDYIIDYRAKTKLLSTYILGMRDYIYPDGKVHTIFQQALTSTGRLSSISPNLQNIPIRTEEGHLIRKMFIPNKVGNKFYSADYSQVELRVLASMANVKHLIDAFNNGIDIHTKTASMVFNKPIDDVTALDRRRAKAVNFGIVYGISAFGLAEDLGITNSLASQFINAYYEAYPEIKEFMDKVTNDCKENGYVKTMYNRIRYIPEINSKIYMQREFAKRMAMNAPIQGSAADIIKVAMINVDKALEDNNLKSKLLVQVHDELVLEVFNGEEEIVQKIVKECMENAVKLSVPLEVSDSFGNNWWEVK